MWKDRRTHQAWQRSIYTLHGSPEIPLFSLWFCLPASLSVQATCVAAVWSLQSFWSSIPPSLPQQAGCAHYSLFFPLSSICFGLIKTHWYFQPSLTLSLQWLQTNCTHTVQRNRHYWYLHNSHSTNPVLIPPANSYPTAIDTDISSHIHHWSRLHINQL